MWMKLTCIYASKCTLWRNGINPSKRHFEVVKKGISKLHLSKAIFLFLTRENLDLYIRWSSYSSSLSTTKYFNVFTNSCRLRGWWANKNKSVLLIRTFFGYLCMWFFFLFISRKYIVCMLLLCEKLLIHLRCAIGKLFNSYRIDESRLFTRVLISMLVNIMKLSPPLLCYILNSMSIQQPQSLEPSKLTLQTKNTSIIILKYIVMSNIDIQKSKYQKVDFH